MQCPKCGSTQPSVAAECSDCGVVFSKFTAAVHARRDTPASGLASPLERMLGGADTLKMDQKARDLAEILVDWEVANEYTLTDGVGRVRGYVVEQGRGAGAMVKRNFLGSHRPFHIAVFSADEREIVLEFERPFFWLLSEVTVKSPDGAKVGVVRRRWSLLRRVYELSDSRGIVFARIISPLLKIWTFPIYDAAGQARGQISKKWTGVMQEYWTDADKFRIEFGPAGWRVDQRAVIVAAAVAIDFDFFENNKGRN